MGLKSFEAMIDLLAQQGNSYYKTPQFNAYYKNIIETLKDNAGELHEKFLITRKNILDGNSEDVSDEFNQAYFKSAESIINALRPLSEYTSKGLNDVNNALKDPRTSSIIHTKEYKALDSISNLVGYYYTFNYWLEKRQSNNIDDVIHTELNSFFDDLYKKCSYEINLSDEDKHYYDQIDDALKTTFNTQFNDYIEFRQFLADISDITRNFITEAKDLNSAMKVHQLCSSTKANSQKKLQEILTNFRYDASGNPLQANAPLIFTDRSDFQADNRELAKEGYCLNLAMDDLSELDENSFTYEDALDTMLIAIQHSALFTGAYDYKFGPNYGDDDYRRAYITHHNIRFYYDVMKVEAAVYNELKDALSHIANYNTLSAQEAFHSETINNFDKLIDESPLVDLFDENNTRDHVNQLKPGLPEIAPRKIPELQALSVNIAALKNAEKPALEYSFSNFNYFNDELEKMDWKFLRFNSKEFKNLQSAMKDIKKFTEKFATGDYDEKYSFNGYKLNKVSNDYSLLLSKLNTAANEYINAKGEDAKFTSQGQHRFEFAKLISNFATSTEAQLANINEMKCNLSNEFQKHPELKTEVKKDIKTRQLDTSIEIENYIKERAKTIAVTKRTEREAERTRVERARGLN